jgi:Arc/MetJ-type ribon-helix-helix transcriptional regulator
MPEVSGRKEIRKEVRFDGYTEKLVEVLMATGDFGNVADLIRAAIQNLYAKYEAQQVPVNLHSITPRILSRSVAKPEEQKSIKVSRRKAKKPEPTSSSVSMKTVKNITTT